jgi:hypothetical protein
MKAILKMKALLTLFLCGAAMLDAQSLGGHPKPAIGGHLKSGQ